MKNLSTKTLIVLFINLVLILSANALTNKDSLTAARKPVKMKMSEQKNSEKGKKENTCLQVIGSALDENGFPLSGIEIILLKDNEELVKQMVYSDEDAQNMIFYGLTRNAHYSIVISKEGYVSRLISISTDLPDDVKIRKNIFVFEFEVSLYAVSDTDNNYYLDFPIAIISYDPASDGFVNHNQYTQHIKKKIQGDREEMAIVKE